MIALVVLLSILSYCTANVGGKNIPQGSDRNSIAQGKDLAAQVDELRKELEALKIKNGDQNTMSGALEMREKASELKDDALDARKEINIGILDTMFFLRSQASETISCLKEMKNTLDDFQGRIEGLEERFGHLEAAMEANGKVTTTIMARQKLTMTEVRLISLYKMTNQSTTHSNKWGEFGSDLAVDGQFEINEGGLSGLGTHSHTNKGRNQKLWIDLGGLFRINRIKIWNFRVSWERLLGTHIYADERLLGVVHSAKSLYEIRVPEGDPTYARSIILNQVKDEYLTVKEVQVWGIGPFSEDDKFA